MTFAPGDKIYRLTLIALEPIEPSVPKKNKKWRVRCVCGTEKVVWQSSLRVIKSCGCWRNERARENIKKAQKAPNNIRGKTHGLSKTPEWFVWCGMRSRCTNPSAGAYARYGGRGIKVCDDWQDFSIFLKDMGERPEGYTLERIDNDGDYCPENCKWASRKTQANNRSSTRWIEAFGKRQNLTTWAEETGINRETITARIDIQGRTPEDALSKKVGH